MMARNPYIDMPLPVAVRIDFDLFARNGAVPGKMGSRGIEAIHEREMLRQVRRAFNVLAYSTKAEAS